MLILHCRSNPNPSPGPDRQAPSTHTVGSFLTAQNSFVQDSSLSWQPDQNWTTIDSGGTPATRTLDSAIIGLYQGSTSQLQSAEVRVRVRVRPLPGLY